MYSYIIILWISLALIQVYVQANYRHLQIDNNDLCREEFPNKHKRISIGTGALILTLSKPRIAFHPHQRKSKLCEIHIQAPEGFGITTYVEEAYMRKNSSDHSCKDYIQFGLDDKLPFLTLDKSQPICGHIDGQRDVRKGFMYDDPHGNLLIWINLFGRKETAHWPAIYTVNLTLVITAYQLNCGVKKSTNSLLKNVQRPGPGFQWCGKDPGPCISKVSYFLGTIFGDDPYFPLPQVSYFPSSGVHISPNKIRLRVPNFPKKIDFMEFMFHQATSELNHYNSDFY